MSKQEKLYRLLEERKVTEEIEELHADESISFDDVKSPKLEPEVNIKTENSIEISCEIYRISEAFESIDYDVSSGKPLSLN